MAVNKQIVYLRGKLQWAKVFDLVPNYNKDGYEWTFDLALDKDGEKQAKQYKVLKTKEKGENTVLSFKQKELRSNGSANNPITVTDAGGKPWPTDTALGNDTVADVKFEIWDFGPGKFPGIYPKAIRVLDHVPYERQEFAPLSADDEFFSKASEAEKDFPATDTFRKDFGLSEDLDDDNEPL